jgi:hypothetical protein
MLLSQRITQTCLFLAGAIALFGGALQISLGQPGSTPEIDNVHRYMAGVYFSTGLVCLWAAATIRRQGTLVYLLGLGVLSGAAGRVVSIIQVGVPEPAAVWLGYIVVELVLSASILSGHVVSRRNVAHTRTAG